MTNIVKVRPTAGEGRGRRNRASLPGHLPPAYILRQQGKVFIGTRRLVVADFAAVRARFEATHTGPGL